MKRPRILTYRPKQRFYIQARTTRLLGRTMLASAEMRRDALLLKSGNLTREEFMKNSVDRVTGLMNAASSSIHNLHQAIAAGIDARMSITQALIVQSQPIPKYPPGGHREGGIAAICESGPEVIINPAGERVSSR